MSKKRKYKKNKPSPAKAKAENKKTKPPEKKAAPPQPKKKPEYRYIRPAARRYTVKSAMQKPPSRKTILGIAGGVVVFAVILVTVLVFFLNRQYPIEGSWEMQKDNTAMYLTIYEDNTAVVTTGGYNVTGTVERKENDILTFQVSMLSTEVLTGDYRYRCTGDTLTLTQESGVVSAGEPVRLEFAKLDHDVTYVTPPEDAQTDPALAGVWSDAQNKIRYTFHLDGTMETELLSLGVSVRGTYAVEGSILAMSKPVDGKMQTEESTYSISGENSLLIGKMAFSKQYG